MKLIRRFRPTPATGIALVALMVALGGAAFAAIPDSGGTVHACYQKANGNLRAVESESECRNNENPLRSAQLARASAATRSWPALAAPGRHR